MGEWVGGWVSEIKIWTNSGCPWRLYMQLTPDLTPQKNCKPPLRLCDTCGTLPLPKYITNKKVNHDHSSESY